MGTETLWLPLPLVTVLVVLSFAGWGALVVRLTSRTLTPDIGLLATYGMGFSAIVGGLLNLAQVVSLDLIRLYLVVGVVAFVGLWVMKRGHGPIMADMRAFVGSLFSDKVLLGLTAVALVLTLCHMVSVRLTHFHPYDDFQGYLSFPVRMLQTGSLQSDPFNLRAAVSSMGGHSFLIALILGVVPLRFVYILEMGVGWLLVVALLLGHGKEKDGSPRLLAALIIVVTSGGVWSPTNLTSTTTSIALFYALLRTFFLREEAVSRLARLFLMALMVSGLIALKTSNVPGCGLIILALFLGVGHKPFRRRIADLVILGLVSLIMLIPWVLGRTGSGFFPTWGLAGRGLVDFPFGPFDTLMACPGRWLVLISMHVVTSFLLLAGLAMVFLPYGKALDALLCRRTRVLILAAAWGTALIQSLLSCEIGIEAINRYTVATVASSTYFLLVEYLSFRGQGQEALTNWARNPALIGLMALSFILGASLPQAKLLALRRYSAYRNPSQAPVNLEAGRLRSMQASIPEGEPIFVWISKPFLLDFKRNYVFNVDVPGAASLAPGLPWEGPSERIAHYLRSMSIRYLVYSYADGGGFPPFKNMDWLRDQRIGLRAATRIATAFQKNLETLGRTYPRVYDDGYLFVLDLRVF